MHIYRNMGSKKRWHLNVAMNWLTHMKMSVSYLT